MKNAQIYINGVPIKKATGISSSFKIKLSKKQKEKLRQMRKHRSGSIPLEIYDPYKDFKAKIKEQILKNR